MKIAASVAGVCSLRDVRDIVPFLCGHYLRIGFGHIMFVDDGSTDGTFEFLSAFSRREPRISVKRIVSETHAQQQRVTDSSNELIERGFSIVFPFDADEFWDIGAREVEAQFAQTPEVAFMGRWVNFVQDSRVDRTRPLGLLAVKHHAPALPEALYEAVTSFKKPFVCYVQSKVAFKTRDAIALMEGQHALSQGPAPVSSPVYEIFHLPLRAKSEITKRALNYEPRYVALRTGKSNWQSAFHHQVVRDGRTDEVWRANSAHRDGHLHCFGERIRLTPDRRLRWLLLRGWAYLAARYGVFAV